MHCSTITESSLAQTHSTPLPGLLNILSHDIDNNSPKTRPTTTMLSHSAAAVRLVPSYAASSLGTDARVCEQLASVVAWQWNGQELNLRRCDH